MKFIPDIHKKGKEMRHFFTSFTLLISLFLLGGTTRASSMAQSAEKKATYEMVIFAGGCFWCLQHPFDDLEGVVSSVVGYTGGKTLNPNYEAVSSGKSGHYESVKIIYDPSKVTLKELLDVFWRNMDPFDAKGQFCDRGEQYRAALFYINKEQKNSFKKSKKEMSKIFKQEIVTEIIPAGEFYNAEEYHQKYYKKNPIRYHFYRFNCGRDKRLKEIADLR